jgi:hypothetical protein
MKDKLPDRFSEYPSTNNSRELTRWMGPVSVDNWPGIENHALTGGDKLPPRPRTFPDATGRVIIRGGEILTFDKHIEKIDYKYRPDGTRYIVRRYLRPTANMTPGIVYRRGNR